MTIALVDTEARVFEELEPPLSGQEAIIEADRCLECGGAHAPAPCSAACPAGIDVPAFVAAVADGDDARAAEVIFAENLLGGTCARVCPTELLCEGACVLLHEGRPPIEIGRLQRHASDAALERSLPLRSREAPSGFRVAVIGAGPAGLACAGELAARGHEVTVYDERPEPGGLVRYAIAPYRLHTRPLPEETAPVESLGARLRNRPRGVAAHVPAAGEASGRAVAALPEALRAPVRAGGGRRARRDPAAGRRGLGPAGRALRRLT
jgi:dihydropyrimidine dehydrogenase (NAD+) subunit PreT